MHWFFIAIIPPILFALVNHLDKYLISRFKNDVTSSERGVGGLILYSTLFCAFAALFVFIFLGGNVVLPISDIIILFFVGFSGVVATILYMYAMEKDEASIVAPLFQMIPVFGLVLEYLILGIIPSAIHIVGSFIIVIAGIVLATEYEGLNVKRIKNSIIFLMLGSSFFFSIISILFKYVTKSAENFWVSSFWEYSSWAIIGLFLFVFIKKYRVDFLKSLKHDGKLLFGINISGEAVNTIGNSLSNFGALLAPIVLVYSVEALQPVFIFIFGIAITVFFPKLSQEDISKKALLKKGIPILFMILGTFLILR